MFNKMKFITMLETLSSTMKDSLQERLHMQDWYKDVSHPCGSAACVIGEQALRRNNAVFPIRKLPQFSTLDHMFPTYYAEDITLQLIETCNSLFVNSLIVDSIYVAESRDRMHYAVNSGAFTTEELDSFSHLSEDDPTPDDASIYIDAVVQKVKEL